MILNIYKPKGWTSFDVVAKVRALTRIKKVGHAGTLDPLAEGVLIVLTDKDTKFQDSFKDLPKSYYFEFIAGVITPSADLESVPIFNSIPDVAELSANAPNAALKFTGQIQQTSPIFSAKKVNGKRLYALARSTDIKTREQALLNLPTSTVTIHEITYEGSSQSEILTDQGTKILPILKWSVKCSSGTYVRTLAEDLAKELHTTAVVSTLIRTGIGDYKIENAVKIGDLKF